MNPPNNIRGVVGFRSLISLGTILFFILVAAYFFYGLQPSRAEGGSLQFKIIKGEGFREIGARLSQNSFIKSISVFKLYSILSGRVQKFQPGLYDLSSAMTLPEIIDVLTSGGKNETSVVIPEGSTVKDIDMILAEAGVIERGALINLPLKELTLNHSFLATVNSFEGFFFPDTYRFKFNSSAKEVADRFLENFEAKAWSLLNGQKNWYDLLILSSFLEREVPDFGDRQIVAGIFLKRLRIGMPLQADASISYAKCDGELKDCLEIRVTKKDLAISSPYNTYQRLGWTPTPISNPGQSAIKAAMTPQATSYIYYLSASGTKDTIFSKTLEEHNLNRSKYL